jgi:hypothetical protein
VSLPAVILEPNGRRLLHRRRDVNTTEKRTPLGVEGLEDVLQGGLIRGRLYLLDGNPGAGKTTLALQFLLEGVRSGERCLYITLSETREELAAGARSHDWALEGIEVLELIASEEELDGQAEITMYHPGEVELTKTTRRVLEAIERVRPERMVWIRCPSCACWRRVRSAIDVRSSRSSNSSSAASAPFYSSTTVRPKARTCNYRASPTASSPSLTARRRTVNRSDSCRSSSFGAATFEAAFTTSRSAKAV